MREYVTKDKKISRTLNNIPRGYTQASIDAIMQTSKNKMFALQNHQYVQDREDLNKIPNINSNKTTSSIIQMNKRRKSHKHRGQVKAKRVATPATPAKFSYLEHYKHKLPHVLDLFTSFRRQRMLVTSTLTRILLHYLKEGSLMSIPIDKIELLHPNSLKDSKTKKRCDTIQKYLRENKGVNKMLKNIITQLMPSDEEIQIAKVGENKYISLQGVGRIVAMKEAAKKLNRNIKIEVMMYDLCGLYLIPGQLEAISKSYNVDESFISKFLGTLLGGSTVFLQILLAKKSFTFLASWIASLMVKQMGRDKIPLG